MYGLAGYMKTYNPVYPLLLGGKAITTSDSHSISSHLYGHFQIIQWKLHPIQITIFVHNLPAWFE